jgi:hypothetical protein
MGNKGLLKRGLPFFATFAFGIFIASFFVNIGRSDFRHHEHGRWSHEMLRFEIEQQREEIRQLREQLEDAQAGTTFSESELPLDVTVPLPPPPIAPRHTIHR